MKKVIWLTGNTGAGKTTTATALTKMMENIIVLDGDEMRATISVGEDLSPEGRKRHNLRVARLAGLLASKGHQVVVAVISPYKSLREEIDAICNPVWVYVKRELPQDTNKPYEVPENPSMIIDTNFISPEEAAAKVATLIK